MLRWVGAGGDRFTDSADISQEMAGKTSQYFGAVKSTLSTGGKAAVVKGVAEDIINPEQSAESTMSAGHDKSRGR